MIDEAMQLGAATVLRIDAVKALQQHWQAEAQSVPLDRKHEQKLWDAFRKPLDEAFNRKTAERERGAAELSVRDRAVLDAAKALDAANATGDAQKIRAAMSALEAALRGQAQERADAAAAQGAASTEKQPNQAPAQDQQAPAAMESGASTGAQAEVAEGVPTSAGAAADADAGADAGPEAAAATAAAPAVPAKPARPVVAVRGDDRPGMKKDAPAAPGRGGRPGERRDARPGRDAGRGDARGAPPMGTGMGIGERGGWQGQEERAPRLGDAAFRAQRDAMEDAQQALRKLAAQAHGEALTQLLSAWEKRDAELLPSVQELGGRVSPAVRSQWAQALQKAPSGDAAQALLRLEIASEVPTPAEHLSAKRLLQLQMLTRRNAASPEQTWGEDAAAVLASASEGARARRLQNALKALLRKA